MRCSYELTLPCNIFTAPRCKITTNPFTNGKETVLSFHGNQRTDIGGSNKPDNRMYKFKVNDTSVKRKNLDNGARSIWTLPPLYHLSRLMGKPTICIGENKDADQLRGNREADQRLCFRY